MNFYNVSTSASEIEIGEIAANSVRLLPLRFLFLHGPTFDKDLPQPLSCCALALK